MNRTFYITYRVDGEVVGNSRISAPNKKTAKRKAQYKKACISHHYSGRRIKIIIR